MGARWWPSRPEQAPSYKAPAKHTHALGSAASLCSSVSLKLECADLHLDFAVLMPVKAAEKVSFQRILLALGSVGILGGAFSFLQKQDLQRFEEALHERNAAQKEQKDYYAHVERSFNEMAETIQRLKRDYYREIDHLRQQLSRQHADSTSQQQLLDDIVFFEPTVYRLPSWSDVIDRLDGNRMKREVLKEQLESPVGGVQNVPVHMLCEKCNAKFETPEEKMAELVGQREIASQTDAPCQQITKSNSAFSSQKTSPRCIVDNTRTSCVSPDAVNCAPSPVKPTDPSPVRAIQGNEDRTPQALATQELGPETTVVLPVAKASPEPRPRFSAGLSTGVAALIGSRDRKVLTIAPCSFASGSIAPQAEGRAASLSTTASDGGLDTVTSEGAPTSPTEAVVLTVEDVGDCDMFGGEVSEPLERDSSARGGWLASDPVVYGQNTMTEASVPDRAQQMAHALIHMTTPGPKQQQHRAFTFWKQKATQLTRVQTASRLLERRMDSMQKHLQRATLVLLRRKDVPSTVEPGVFGPPPSLPVRRVVSSSRSSNRSGLTASVGSCNPSMFLPPESVRLVVAIGENREASKDSSLRENIQEDTVPLDPFLGQRAFTPNEAMAIQVGRSIACPSARRPSSRSHAAVSSGGGQATACGDDPRRLASVDFGDRGFPLPRLHTGTSPGANCNAAGAVERPPLMPGRWSARQRPTPCPPPGCSPSPPPGASPSPSPRLTSRSTSRSSPAHSPDTRDVDTDNFPPVASLALPRPSSTAASPRVFREFRRTPQRSC